jgi:urease accessory protein
MDTGTPAHQMQRSHGRATVRMGLRDGRGVLQGLAQAGSAKVFLPRSHAPDPEAVFLNTSGGLTGGDRLAFDITLDRGVRLTATTQTAERGYASTGAPARVTVTASVGPGGRLDWLPQETILYEFAHLERSTTIDLGAAAECLICEAVILGRHAMGETLAHARLTDRRRITRAARPVLVDAFRLGPGVLARGDGPALLGGARAFAFVALVADDAQDALRPLRAVLDEPGVTAAASAMDGRLVARIAARDGYPLRRQLARALAVLRPGHPAPRVWQI